MPTVNVRTPITNQDLGGLLKGERRKKKLTLEQASAATKIRKEFLESLENNDFSSFASEVYTKGFLRNYGLFLGIDPDKLAAMYRRQQNIETKKVNKNTKETRSKLREFLTSQRGLAFFSLAIVGFLVILYVANQLGAAFSPPYLKIFSPVEITADFEGEIFVAGNSFRIEGEVSPNTVVRLNSEPLALKPGNKFETTEIPLHESKATIIILATNQFARSSTIVLNVKRGKTGVADVDKMSILIEVETEATPILMRTDGVIRFNDVAFVGDIIQAEAEQRLQIESSAPFNLIVTINGEEYRFTKRNQVWELIDGQVLVK